MVHRKHRPDSNRDEIVKALEEKPRRGTINLGNVGEGVPDLASPHYVYIPDLIKKLQELLKSGEVPYIWQTDWFEIKSPKGTYTPKELKFQERFPGLVVTLRSKEDVERL